MKMFLKRTLGRLAKAGNGRSDRRVILLYHSVGSGPWALPERIFSSQIDWLHRSARFVSTSQLVQQEPGGSLQVAITFDDGYASLHDAALPVLRDFGAVASVFLNTGHVAAKTRSRSNMALGHYPNEYFLSWKDATRLANERWSIGSHGVNHIDLTRANEDGIQAELAASKSAIERILGIPCNLFAYTWGNHNRNLRKLVAQAGYQYAFSGHHSPIYSNSDPFAIPRINIHNAYTMDDFKAIVLGDWDYLGWVQKIKAAL